MLNLGVEPRRMGVEGGVVTPRVLTGGGAEEGVVPTGGVRDVGVVGEAEEGLVAAVLLRVWVLAKEGI